MDPIEKKPLNHFLPGTSVLSFGTCRICKGAVIAFGVALVVIQIGDTYIPRNALTDKETVTGVWIFYTLFIVVAFATEKIGSRRQINAT